MQFYTKWVCQYVETVQTPHAEKKLNQLKLHE